MPNSPSDVERRTAYESCLLDEHPRLTNINQVIAYEYFNSGWEANSNYYINQMLHKRVKLSLNDFNATNLQVAVLTAIEGKPTEKEEALRFLQTFIHNQREKVDSYLSLPNI